MATLAMPLTRALASLGDALVRELIGQLAHPLLHPVADLVLADVRSDHRQRLELVDRLRQLLRELAGLVDGLRTEHADEQRGDTADGDGDDGDGEAAPQVPAPFDRTDDGVEGEGDQHADPDPGEHRRGVADQGDQRQSRQHGDDEVGERSPVEAQSVARAGHHLGVDAQRRRVLVHAADDGMPAPASDRRRRKPPRWRRLR